MTSFQSCHCQSHINQRKSHCYSKHCCCYKHPAKCIYDKFYELSPHDCYPRKKVRLLTPLKKRSNDDCFNSNRILRVKGERYMSIHNDCHCDDCRKHHHNDCGCHKHHHRHDDCKCRKNHDHHDDWNEQMNHHNDDCGSHKHSHDDCGCHKHHHDDCGCHKHDHHDDCDCHKHHHHNDDCSCHKHHHHDDCGCHKHHHDDCSCHKCHHNCYCDDRFSIRLGGLTSGMSFRLRQLLDCDVKIMVTDNERIQGRLVNVGTDFAEVMVKEVPNKKRKKDCKCKMRSRIIPFESMMSIENLH